MTPGQQIDQHYVELELGLNVVDNPDYSRLVVANGNSREPFHRWFHMKEAYSSQLVRRVVKDLNLEGRRNLRILDPFSGSGTTAVSVLQHAGAGELISPTVYGLESNPFLALVGAAKVGALLDPPVAFFRFAQGIAATAFRDKANYELPALSTFKSERFFRPDDVQVLLRIRESIDCASRSGESPLVAALARLALGASIEKVANLRRDGRALRYVERVRQEHPIDVFLAVCEQIDEDLPPGPALGAGRVYQGDGISMGAIDGRFAAFDLVVCSPPYPNNIDYTEVYKLENWLLGFISSAEEFTNQRKATLHSHPSIRRSGRLASTDIPTARRQALRDLVDPVLNNLPDDRYRRGRTEVIEGYVVDMYRMLKAAAARLLPGGQLAIVVGNSAHGKSESQHVVAADLFIARAAQIAGFRIERLEVARTLHRRSCSSPFLRESLIFATKP